MQRRRRRQSEIALFRQFPVQRLQQCLADFHAATWQMPAVDIAVFDQKNRAGLVDHDGSYAKRHSTREAPVEMQTATQQGFDSCSDALHEALSWKERVSAAHEPRLKRMAGLPRIGC